MLYRLDRLSRSPLGCASLLHEFRECGVGLVIVTAPELGHTAQDSFMLNILAAFAEFEREMTASRIAESRARLKTRGRRIAGAVPCGLQVSAPMIEAALPRNLQILWGLRLDSKQIRDHVESVVYDPRDENLRVKAIPPIDSGVR